MKNRLALPAFLLVLAISTTACTFSNLLSMAGTTTSSSSSSPTSAPAATLAAPSQPVDLNTQQGEIEALYQQYSPSVVTIQVFNSTTYGTASGWVYDSSGDIVTNDHVVSGMTQVEVDFSSGYKAFAKVIGEDAYSDLAVIKVSAPASDLIPLTLGDSDQLKIGQTVVAIGNPFGLAGSMTSGIVSALDRSLESGSATSSGLYYSNPDIIQTDAALNPGNSGGPLFNLQGQVVGINSDLVSENTSPTGEASSSGVGFAIAINLVKRVVPSLIATGKYSYPYLGLAGTDGLPLSVLQSLNLQTTTGVYVTDVTAGGPADKAGVKAGTTPTNISGYQGLMAGGDVIVGVDGQTVQTFDQLERYLVLNKVPGDTVTLTVLRGSQKVDLPLTLGTRP
jgi:2-alkenal reductase